MDNAKTELSITRKELRSRVNKLIGGLLIYEIIMVVIVLSDMIIRMVLALSQTTLDNVDKVINEVSETISESGASTIAAIVIGLPVLILFFKKMNLKERIFINYKRMKLPTFLMLLSVLMSAQMVFNIFATVIELILNSFGFSILAEVESASAGSSTISMFLYACLIGPITEEVIFRGFLMRGLEKYGRHFAIIVSSVAFGAYHGNLVQGLFATLVGIVFAYTAMEYSIKWSITLHIFNNFVFGDLWLFLTKGLSLDMQNTMFYVIQLVFFIAAIIILYVKRRDISGYVSINKSQKGYYRYAFTSVLMIIFLVIQLAIGIIGIQKI